MLFDALVVAYMARKYFLGKYPNTLLPYEAYTGFYQVHCEAEVCPIKDSGYSIYISKTRNDGWQLTEVLRYMK